MTPRLTKQCALTILRVAGVPRFNHVVRSLPPRLTEGSAAAFDKQVLTAFQSICGFTDTELTPEVTAQAQLPLRLGGGGLRSYVKTAPAAYLGAAALAAEHRVATACAVLRAVRSARSGSGCGRGRRGTCTRRGG